MYLRLMALGPLRAALQGQRQSSAGVPPTSSGGVSPPDSLVEQPVFSESSTGTELELAGGTPNATRISRHVVGVFCGPGHVIRPAGGRIPAGGAERGARWDAVGGGEVIGIG